MRLKVPELEAQEESKPETAAESPVVVATISEPSARGDVVPEKATISEEPANVEAKQAESEETPKTSPEKDVTDLDETSDDKETSQVEVKEETTVTEPKTDSGPSQPTEVAKAKNRGF